ncbi:hypothetical protein PR048_015145 [Dryococelus australis]|uniref:Uncharacterized protein n=1 Tax=Dryococelus australis TaxID=614101 RepID=A0ABQ9HG52_9NEOP|nr:hypothetical protein PR048_015145 [Dryococelus australis]
MMMELEGGHGNSTTTCSKLIELGLSAPRVFLDKAGPSGLPCPLASPIAAASSSDEQLERAFDWSSDSDFEDCPSEPGSPEVYCQDVRLTKDIGLNILHRHVSSQLRRIKYAHLTDFLRAKAYSARIREELKTLKCVFLLPGELRYVSKNPQRVYLIKHAAHNDICRRGIKKKFPRLAWYSRETTKRACERSAREIPHWEGSELTCRQKATVAERLDYSPPTKTNRVQSPTGYSGFSRMENVPDDAAGRRVFSGISRFLPPLYSGVAPVSAHLFLIGSQNLVVRGKTGSSLCGAGMLRKTRNLFCDARQQASLGDTHRIFRCQENTPRRQSSVAHGGCVLDDRRRNIIGAYRVVWEVGHGSSALEAVHEGKAGFKGRLVFKYLADKEQRFAKGGGGGSSRRNARGFQNHRVNMNDEGAYYMTTLTKALKSSRPVKFTVTSRSPLAAYPVVVPRKHGSRPGKSREFVACLCRVKVLMKLSWRWTGKTAHAAPHCTPTPLIPLPFVQKMNLWEKIVSIHGHGTTPQNTSSAICPLPTNAELFFGGLSFRRPHTLLSVQHCKTCLVPPPIPALYHHHKVRFWVTGLSMEKAEEPPLMIQCHTPPPLTLLKNVFFGYLGN